MTGLAFGQLGETEGNKSDSFSLLKSQNKVVNAEGFEPIVFSGMELLKYNFNPGVSFGLGGGRLQYAIPNVSLKMGIWTLSGMVGADGGYYGRNVSYQIDLELPYSISKKSA